MSVTGLESRQEVLSAANAATKAHKPEAQEESTVAAGDAAPDFAALLQGRLGRNMALTRADAQLSVPERASASERAGALTDQRPRDPGFDSSTRDEAPSARSDDRQPRAAEAAGRERPTGEPRADQASDRPASRAANDGGETAASKNDRPAGREQAAAGTASAKPDDAAASARAAVDPRTAAAQKQPAAQQGQAAAAAQQAARPGAAAGNTNTTGNNNAQSRPFADLPVTVQVTRSAPGQSAQQPQAALAGESAIAAQSARPGAAQPGTTAGSPQPQTGDAPAAATTPEEAARILASLRGQATGQANGQPATADGKKPSNAAPSAQAARAKAEAQTGATGQKPDLPAQAAPQASAGPQPMPKPGAPGLQTALEAGGRASALTGSGKPSIGTDPLSGGTALTGQNNSVQHRSAPAHPAQAARNAPTPPPIADQIAVQIQKAAGAGGDRIQIQLKPAELGRVEIKMEMSHDGRLTAVISADKAETLDLLRQDSRQLLQTLNDAGLKADQQSLSFNLRGQQNEGGGDGGGKGGDGGLDDGDMLADEADPFDDIGETGGFTADGRLNMRV